MGLQVFLGTFLSPDTPTTLTTCTALVVRNGVILRRCTTADEATALVAELGHGPDITYIDGGNGLFIPGFADIHWHAPQFANLGVGLDLPLLPRLEKYTFPEEARFKDLDYANAVFDKLLASLLASGTTSSVIFGSLHREATEQLMARLAQGMAADLLTTLVLATDATVAVAPADDAMAIRAPSPSACRCRKATMPPCRPW